MPKEETSRVAFEADISQFSQAIAEMRSDIKLMNSQFEASSSSLEDWSNSSEGLEAKIKQLNGVLEAEKNKLNALKGTRDEYNSTLEKNKNKLAELKAEYDKVVASEGENSASAKKLAKDIAKVETAITKNSKSIKYYETEMNKQQATVNKTEKELKDYKKALEDVDKKTKDASDSAGGFSKAMKGIGKGLAAGVVAIGAAAAGAATSFLALAESTREYREDLAKLNNNAKTAGVAQEAVTKALRDLNAITGETDSNVEALSNLLMANFTESNMANAVETLSDAVLKFPDTLKIEGLADGLQESMQQMEMGNNATGQYAELLERLGYNLDTVTEQYGALGSEEEKQAYLLDLVNKKIGGTSDTYREQNKDLVDAANAQFDLNEALSNLGAVAEPIVSILKSGLAKVLEALTPLITQVAEAFKQLLSGDIKGGLESFSEIFLSIREKANEAFLGMLNGLSEIIPQMLPKIAEFLMQAVQKIVEFAPLALEAALQLFGAIVEALPPTINSLIQQLPTLLNSIASSLTSMIPTLLENAINFLMTIVQALPTVVQNLVSALPQLINTILDFVISNLPVVYQGFLKLLMSIVDALPSVIVSIVKEIPKLITSIVKTVASNLPKLLAMSIDMWLQMVKAIPKFIPKLLSGIGDIITSILDAFDTDMLVDVGASIIEGLWDGIKSLKDWLKKKLESAADWLPKWIKDKLGIASPSKVFKEIGKFSADGLGVGFTDEMKKVKKSIVNSVDMAGVGLNGNVAVSGGNTTGIGSKVVNLNYTVNSPRQLSRREIYIQANKMKTLLGGVN